jgi:hydroxyacylglutathione hydrolase
MSDLAKLNVEIVACLSDNYAYLIDSGSAGMVVIDPSEGAPVMQALGARPLRAILATHHHQDHIGGIEALLEAFPGIPVFGHASDRTRITALTHALKDGERFELGSLQIQALHGPGHTRGALTYVVHREGSPRDLCAFTGDTLFGAGCGRLFEGTPREMRTSLTRLASELPGSTQIYCGHEYTESNLRFALHAEPGSVAIEKRLAKVRAQRGLGRPSVPSTIAEECETNPFLRTHLPALRHGLGIPEAADADEAFRLTREAKNQF